ncbi:MAG: NAD(P)/FAD-dependent oxidoreductase [Pararhodobacter sp.]
MTSLAPLFRDLIVIGAGPAGGNAALAAVRAGLDVLIVDEGVQPGGQVWRAPAPGMTPAPDADFERGASLRQRLQQAAIPIRSETGVWSVAPIEGGFEVALAGPEGPELIQTRRLLVATGAQERVVPFAGWTLPGVFGLAAATVLLKSSNFLPGRRILVAGQGPLLIAVAAKALKLGKAPVAVVDYNSRLDWLRSLPGFVRHLPSFRQGLIWQAQLARAGVRVRRQSEILRAEPDATGILGAVTIGPVGGGAPQRVEVDTLLVGNGLVPGDEILRLLGARQRPDPFGGWQVEADETGRSSVPGLYVAGDCGRIRGALPAADQGERTGTAIAQDAGRAVSAPPRRNPALERFADASCALMRVEDRRIAALPDDVILCRCEDVTVGAVRAAIADGAQDANQLKHFTRLGMGPCQGRMCGANAAALLRLSPGTRPGGERLTPRSPLRPVEIPQMAGSFDYADIPVPKPAPL